MTDCTECGVWVPQSAVQPPPTGLLAITGTPSTTAIVGTPYSFTPAITGGLATPTALISNKPPWANFNAVTGQMSGTPNAAEVDANITISASDGFTTVSLAPFSITVSAAVHPVLYSFPLIFMGYT